MITISEIKELNIYSHLYTEVLLKIEELLKLTHGIELNSRKSFLGMWAGAALPMPLTPTRKAGARNMHI